MRIILHIDMDAFFASIEERENPALKGKSIVVGADPKGGRGRGVVSTASYAARKFGIHSAMPISKAWQLCPTPQCAYLPVDMRLYEIVSGRIMKLVRECVGNAPMEQVSVDESYVEINNAECRMQNCWEEAEMIAKVIKHEIQKCERLTCSIGIGPNKLIAKIASDFNKPDGLTIVRPEEVQEFLDPLPVRKLPGIGSKTEKELQGRGIKTILDLRLSLAQNEALFEHAHGLDETPVVEDYEAKSLGREVTFEHDTRNQAILTRTIMELCAEVGEEVRQQGWHFRTVIVRVRFDNFETHTSRKTLPASTADDTLLKQAALRLVFPYFKDKRLIRLVGVRVANFTQREEGR